MPELFSLQRPPARRSATGGLGLQGMSPASMAAPARLGAAEATPHGAPGTTLSVRTLGSLEVSLDGASLELPASRRTRALLAFLVLSRGLQRRARLCELFWDAPRDPRASLRWSLSKLRSVINADGCARLITDRERVQITPAAVSVDFHELRACANDETASAAALSQAWELSNQLLIEDCELPDQPDFMAWLQHQRNESARLRAQLSQRLALLPDLPAEQAEQWAERWLHEAPGDARAAQQVIMTRRRLGRGQLAAERTAELESPVREPVLPQSGSAESPVQGESVNLAATEAAGTVVPEQVTRFVQAEDGTALAWSSIGATGNPPLVNAANWLAPVEFDREAPICSPLFRDLARSFRFIRYDERGCGLSDGEASPSSLDKAVADLQKVVDAAGLECFPLLGMGQGACVSIEFAARYPERVSHLILLGGYAAGWRHTATPEECREREAIMVLTEAGWDRDHPAYRNLFSMSLMPDANSEELGWFDDFQRRTTSAGNARRLLEASSRIDVRHRLEAVTAPTLVLHSRGDAVVPVAIARELARRIANAQFVSLDSNNHLLLGRERAANEFLWHVRRFLERDGSSRSSDTAVRALGIAAG